MKVKINLFLLVMISLTLLGCATTGNITNNTTSSNHTNSYYPNTDGYEWKYDVSSWNSYTGTTSTSEGTQKVNGSYTYSNGLTLQKFYQESLSVSQEALTEVTASTVKTYGNTIFPTAESTTLLSLPLSVNASWNYYQNYKAQVVAQENVTVPLGTYNAYKVYYEPYNNVSQYIWFAENIGAIKSEITTVSIVIIPGTIPIPITVTSIISLDAKSINF